MLSNLSLCFLVFLCNKFIGKVLPCARKCCQEERRVTGYDYVLRKANHDLGASGGV